MKHLTEYIEVALKDLPDVANTTGSRHAIIFYHGGCLDGMFAAAVVARELPEYSIFVPVQYGNVLEDWSCLAGKEVWIVDFSFAPKDMADIFQHCDTLTWIDHHKSAIDRRHEWMDAIAQSSRADALVAVYSTDNTASGAMLALQVMGYRKSVPVNAIIRAIDDRDRWVFQYSDTKAICASLYSICSTALEAVVELAYASLFVIDNYITEGNALLREQAKQVDALVPTAVEMDNVVYCNAPHFLASELGHTLVSKHGKAACIYQVLSDGIKLSYRSDDTCTIKAQELAKHRGGGGHMHAAGAIIKDPRAQYAFLHDIISYVKWEEV